MPGISSNGIQSGWYYNKVSINLLAGISAGSQRFEIAGISNLSLRESSGLQISGFANIVGSNTYLNLSQAQERAVRKELNMLAHFHGIQLTSGVNLVRDNVHGAQIGGAFNVAQSAMFGFQLAGLGNVVYEDMSGVQFAGLYNIGKRSVAGFQVSLLANYTKGPMAGLQLGIFNRNTGMFGKNMDAVVKTRSFQFGLINVTKKMLGGTQVGLINVAGEMAGTQVGLINLFSKLPVAGAVRNGLPVGIINYGSVGSVVRVSTSDSFLFNFELSSGNCSNCPKTKFGLPFDDRFQKLNQNVLVFGYNPEPFRDEKGHWSLGLRFERIMYIKYTMIPMRRGPQNKNFFLSIGAGVHHINWTHKFRSELNLQPSLAFTAGRKLAFLGFRYLYGSLRLNGYITNSDHHDLTRKSVLYENKENTFRKLWLGYGMGVQF